MSTIETFRSGDPRYLTAETGSIRAKFGTTSLLSAVFQAISAMAEKRRSRLALLSMTDEQLKDIGLSRADAEREGLRNPWE
jgi:uncharacterized protein YjiS (DUF1127 family)